MEDNGDAKRTELGRVGERPFWILSLSILIRAIRESSYTQAHAILSNAKEAVIRLCDTSTSGLGFRVSREFAHSFYRGQEVKIKFRGGSGSMAHRRIRVQNINGNRIGGKFS